jgi:hypothetical protein
MPDLLQPTPDVLLQGDQLVLEYGEGDDYFALSFAGICEVTDENLLAMNRVFFWLRLRHLSEPDTPAGFHQRERFGDA